MITGPPLVRVKNLRHRYDDGTEALQGVDFELAQGETVAILGPNGSGKTTFLLQLNGLLRGEGTIEIAGLPLEARTLPLIRKMVGLLFQDPDDQLFQPSVLEDVSFGPIQLGLPQEEVRLRSEEALRKVGLTAGWNKPPYHLSAGEKQRAALAGILAMQPRLLVLDEPTTHLDPPARRQLAELLHTLPQGKLIVTHDLPFARALATRAVFFVNGVVAADGPLDEIIHRYEWA